MRTGVNISVNAIFAKIFYEKQKRVSTKSLMKNKYLITKYSGKCKAFLWWQGCKLFKNNFSRKNINLIRWAMNNYFINITKPSNLKALNKSQADIEKFENHISIKNTQNISRNFYRKFSFWTSIQRYHKKRNMKSKC